MKENKFKIAIVGNPNSGKTSLFNKLTGLNQKVGNFAGVTVEKKTGVFEFQDKKFEVLDLPGTYSIYPKSPDEQIVFDYLLNPEPEEKPDAILVVLDASNLSRNLLLYSQLADLGLPLLLVLNMMDLVRKQGIEIQLEKLSEKLGVEVICINARTGDGIEYLKGRITFAKSPQKHFFEDLMQSNLPSDLQNISETIKEKIQTIAASRPVLILVLEKFQQFGWYNAWQVLQLFQGTRWLTEDQKKHLQEIVNPIATEIKFWQAKETIVRYEWIKQLVEQVLVKNQTASRSLSKTIDKFLLNGFSGYFVFFAVLFSMFQVVFSLSTYPMDWIEGGMGWAADLLITLLPPGLLTDLLTQGILPGLAGILVFIPQIAFLFLFIALLEETGYMSRVIFLTDRVMHAIGLHGKSIVPLISGAACAVPAIMSTRSIDNWRDRLITIFVTPLMSCSARIPVFTILIALVIPDEKWFGIINLQGLALMALYVLGFLSAILTALAMKKLMKSSSSSYLIMELPSYKVPRWQNVGITILEKVKAFVFEAGKIILAISILLWFLASFGPGNSMQDAELQAKSKAGIHADQTSINNQIAAAKLEASYAGQMGKWMEPVIRPLGFDWKIGIALLTSFAAREVFVGTLATIYAIGADESENTTIKNRMKREIRATTGKTLYDLPLCASLLVFYVYAMQCMSTLAVVYRETKTWKWPIIQLVYMSFLAYVASFMVFQLLSA